VTLLYKLSENEVVLYVNYQGLFRWSASSKTSGRGTTTQLGALDFYAIDNALFFIDEFCIAQRSNTNGEIEGRSTIPVVKMTEHTTTITKPYAGTTEEASILEQNYPNPVRTMTTIPMTIAAGVQEAALTVVDVHGKMVQRVNIEDRGHLQFELQMNLDNGIYFYSLIADGKVIATKRMVVTQ
jgi:hypothetical protein